MNSEKVAEILASGMTSKHETGEPIFKQGDKSGELHVVLSCRVAIVDEGRTVAPVKAGGLLSETLRTSDAPRRVSAVAIETTRLVTLSRASIKHLQNATNDSGLAATLDRLLHNAYTINLKRGFTLEERSPKP